MFIRTIKIPLSDFLCRNHEFIFLEAIWFTQGDFDGIELFSNAKSVRFCCGGRVVWCLLDRERCDGGNEIILVVFNIEALADGTGDLRHISLIIMVDYSTACLRLSSCAKWFKRFCEATLCGAHWFTGLLTANYTREGNELVDANIAVVQASRKSFHASEMSPMRRCAA